MSSPAVEELEPQPSGPSPQDSSVVRDLAKGTSALALGTIIERGFGFFANVVAARVAGTSVYGAYSLAMTTANMIASYAAGGIGSTATRYSAHYPRESAGYSALVKALAVISVSSAIVAILLLYSTAGLVAGPWLHNAALAPTLRLAAFSAGGIILLECCRGFFIGQRKFAALVLLSVLVGGGLITVLPITSHFGATAMVATQASAAAAAVLACLVLAGRLGLKPLIQPVDRSFGRLLREIWRFGLVQLGGLIMLNLGGWWLTSLVARSDGTLAQVGLFSISLQLRNMVALAPAMLSESALGLMVDPQGSKGSPTRVLAICTFASVAVTFGCSGLGILVAPWLLPAVYGKAYTAAVLPVSLGLATAVVHMGSAPASARTTVLSIRFWGWTNFWWAVFVVTFASLFVPRGGAAAGVGVYLGAQGLMAVLLFAWLSIKREVAGGVIKIYACGSIGILILTGLAYIRDTNPATTALTTAAIAVVLVLNFALIYKIGSGNGTAPRPQEIRRAVAALKTKIQSMRNGSR